MEAKIILKQEVFIAFHLADPAGRLFYGNLAHLAHQSLETGIQKMGIKWKTWFNHPEWVIPIKTLTNDFFAPLMAGQTYDLQLSLTKVGQHSMQFETQIFDGEKLCAKSISTHVFVSTATEKKCPIPEAVSKHLP